MSETLRRLLEGMIPIIGMIVSVILFIIGLFIFSYFLIIGTIVVLILFLVAFIGLKIDKYKRKKEPSFGRIIEYNKTE